MGLNNKKEEIMIKYKSFCILFIGGLLMILLLYVGTLIPISVAATKITLPKDNKEYTYVSLQSQTDKTQDTTAREIEKYILSIYEGRDIQLSLYKKYKDCIYTYEVRNEMAYIYKTDIVGNKESNMKIAHYFQIITIPKYKKAL